MQDRSPDQLPRVQRREYVSMHATWQRYFAGLPSFSDMDPAADPCEVRGDVRSLSRKARRRKMAETPQETPQETPGEPTQETPQLPACCIPSPDATPAEKEYCTYLRGGDPRRAGLAWNDAPCPEWRSDRMSADVRAKWWAVATAHEEAVEKARKEARREARAEALAEVRKVFIAEYRGMGPGEEKVDAILEGVLKTIIEK